MFLRVFARRSFILITGLIGFSDDLLYASESYHLNLTKAKSPTWLLYATRFDFSVARV
ncbi:hypothetical protein HMPREF1051_1738 [Neisseria sicca VK64]|uniref:Uncharacterized protein n=1 Tax=Neisseria sicca VK64 TaxID=1095748 RepID=I2NMI1_NEISI|nr:hypothetical protein HMPREF1051_1738 [Neisseria sicca VK64]